MPLLTAHSLIAKPMMIGTDAHAAGEMSPINIATSILLPGRRGIKRRLRRDMWWSGVLRCIFAVEVRGAPHPEPISRLRLSAELIRPRRQTATAETASKVSTPPNTPRLRPPPPLAEPSSE
jgi:hypothetical protein